MKTSLEEYMRRFEEIQNETETQLVMLPEDEPRFIIDSNTRKITIPEDFTFLGVLNDTTFETIYFEIDRYYDKYDLKDHRCVVQYMIVDGEDVLSEGIYVVDKYDIETVQDKLIFGWTIKSDVTKYAADVNFAIRFYTTASNDEDIYFTFCLNTRTTYLPVVKTLDVTAGDIGVENETLMGWIETLQKYTKSEDSRVEAETARVEAENSRAEAEAARVETENSRVEAENVRQTAEEVRQSNEDTRIANEEARVEAENAREDAETGYVAQAKTSADAAATSETNAKTSETNAATSETNAATSEANAKISETNAALSESNAATSEANASDSATLAESWAVGGTNTRDGEDADNSKYYAEQSATSAAASETSNQTSIKSAEEALASQTAAATSETNAKTSEINAATSETNAANSATLTESWAVGGTGTRDGEDTDNSKYYAEQARKDLEQLSNKMYFVSQGVNILTITISAQNWVSNIDTDNSSYIYSNDVEVSGVTEEYYPIVTLDESSARIASSASMSSLVRTGTGIVRFYSETIPSSDMTAHIALLYSTDGDVLTELPVATSDTLGVVKIGNGISVDTDGTISTT